MMLVVVRLAGRWGGLRVSVDIGSLGIWIAWGPVSKIGGGRFCG